MKATGVTLWTTGDFCGIASRSLLPDTFFWALHTQPQWDGPKKRTYSVSGICAETNTNWFLLVLGKL